MPPLEHTLTLNAPVHRVYAWWTHARNLPVAFPGLIAVERSELQPDRWIFEGPEGAQLVWDAVLEVDLPQRQLVWEGRESSAVRLALDFEALAHGRTRVRLSLDGPAETFPLPLSAGLPQVLGRFEGLMSEAGVESESLGEGPFQSYFLRGIAATAGALTVFALAWSLVALIEVWVIVLGALLVAAALGPAVDALMRSQVPRAAAVGITFLGVTAGATVVLMVLVPQVMTQGQDLSASLPAYLDRFQEMLTRAHARHPAIPEGGRLFGYLADTGPQVLGNAFSITGKFVWLTIVVLSILFLAFFMLLDGRRLQETVVRLLPLRKRSQLPALLRMVEQRVGGYMAGLGIICIVAGVLTWAALAALGLPYALLVGAVTALLQAIPFVGPLVGGAMAGLIGFSISGSLAIWALVVYTAIQQLIGQVLFPWIMGRSIGMHPVWVAVVLLVGGTLYGLTGAFLAIPVAIAVSIILECYYLPWAEAQFSSEDGTLAPPGA